MIHLLHILHLRLVKHAQVLHASIWMQKITIVVIAYVFFSLDSASGRIRRYRMGYFANIYICIIRTFSHIKQKIVSILAIKQLPYDPKSENFEVIGYFQEAFLLKQWRKCATSLVTNFLPSGLCPRSLKTSYHEIGWLQTTDVPQTQQRILHRKWAKKPYGTHSYVRASQGFGCMSPWNHYCLHVFLDGSLGIQWLGYHSYRSCSLLPQDQDQPCCYHLFWTLEDQFAF